MRRKKSAFLLCSIFALSLCAYAGDGQTLKTSCETALTKAEIIAAHRKWWPERPDPKANVLNVRTHANFSKDLLPVVGGFLSHEKIGELVFQEQGDSCLVLSNGHPADVVLSDLAKAFASSPSVSAAKPTGKKGDPPGPSKSLLIAALGISVSKTDDGKGVQIADVTPGGVADFSGLHQSDIITTVNGKPVNTPMELAVALSDLTGKVKVGSLFHTSVMGWMPKETTVLIAK